MDTNECKNENATKPWYQVLCDKKVLPVVYYPLATAI